MRGATDIENRPSVCPLDCPDTCSLSVQVQGGEIVSVRGSHTNPYTAGVICEKVGKYYPAFVHGARRLTRPLKRIGAKGSEAYAPVTWDEALDLVYQGVSRSIEAHGPQSVLPLNYAGPHGQLAVGSMDRRFFHKMGASLLDRGPLCGGVRGTAYTSLFGAAPGMHPEQARHSDVIAVWGNNVTVSNLHLQRVLKDARERGAKIVIVDPKRIRVAEQAHLFVQIRPGTDVVLALALAAEIERRGALDEAFVERWVSGFDAFMAEARKYTLADASRICRVPMQVVEQLAEFYVNAKTLAVSIGNGIERGRSGGSGLRAIMSLSAILGQFGRLGAGVCAKPGLGAPTTPDKLQRPDLVPSGTRTINIVDVGELLLDEDLDPPIGAVFIYNHNPISTHPDQNRMRRAFDREDLFVVGIDVVMTDSMRYADVVLPAASHFEFHDIYVAYGHSYVQRAEPVIPPLGESQPNTEIFRRLAKRFGYDDPMFRESDLELIDAALDPGHPKLQGRRASELPLGEAVLMRGNDGEEAVMCKNVFPATPSGKIELFSEALETGYGYGIPRYEAVEGDRPFMLISPSSSKRTNATFGGDDASLGLEVLEVHPEDAAAKGIVDGTPVKVWNGLGETVLLAKLSEAMQPGVVYSPKGTWLETSPTGQTVNALLDADWRTDILRGACYNDTFVDIAPV